MAMCSSDRLLARGKRGVCAHYCNGLRDAADSDAKNVNKLVM
jgi:hypothetical protein